jgi:hypothetical protein
MESLTFVKHAFFQLWPIKNMLEVRIRTKKNREYSHGFFTKQNVLD